MRSNEIICDDCEVERTAMMETTSMAYRRDVEGMVVVYRFANGWAHVPLAFDGIDICPKCEVKKPDLSALTRKVRSR